jgi:multiple sugar transport system ATP-binding protein
VLDGGRLQQAGAPQQVYDRPANAFVATFLGNPGMNIFAARPGRESGMLELAAGGWHIPVEPLLRRNPRLADHLGDSLLAGLRPESFSTRQAPRAKVVVTAVESLGHERLVYFTPRDTAAGGEPEPMVARLVGPQAEKAGQAIELGFDPARLYFFTQAGDLIA